MNILKREKIKSIVMSVAAIILGILFCVIPNESLSVIETIASICLIAYGTIGIFVYSFTPVLFRESMMLINGVFCIGLGLLIIFVPSFFVFGVGLVVALNGLERFGYSFDVKEVHDKYWWIDMIAGLFMFALGVTTIILCNTSVATNILMIYFGVSVALDGLLNLILIFALHREIKRVKKFIKSNGEDFTDYEVK